MTLKTLTHETANMGIANPYIITGRIPNPPEQKSLMYIEDSLKRQITVRDNRSGNRSNNRLGNRSDNRSDNCSDNRLGNRSDNCSGGFAIRPQLI